MRQNRTYIKQGDFLKIFDTGANLNRQVSYKNRNDNPRLVKFTISGYRSDDNIQVYLTFAGRVFLEAFIQSCSSNIKTINTTNDKSEGFGLFPGKFGAWFITDDKNLLKELILTIHQFDPLDDETKKELMLALGITKPILFADVVTLVQSDNFNAALSLAKEDDNPDTLWMLGKFCESNLQNDLQRAIECYKLIPRGNPHYEEANEILFHNLLTQDPSNLRVDEKLKLLESKFVRALESGETNANLSAQLFHELCGFTDLNPPNKTIKGDAETLITLAEQMRALVKRNHELMAEVQVLRSLSNAESSPERAPSTDGKSEVKSVVMILPASPRMFKSVTPSQDSNERSLEITMEPE